MKYINPSSIKLEKDSIFDKSTQVGLDYCMKVNPDRLLAPCFEVHGLASPAKAIRYGGWERNAGANWGPMPETFTLAGHSLGHWMSAMAGFYSVDKNTAVLDKLLYVVNQLNIIQETTGSGYIGGCLEEPFQKAFAGEENWCEGFWVPWYGIHKIYQGLVDTFLFTKDEVSLKVLTRFADWAVEGIDEMSEEQMQHMLDIEYGGMNEIFAELYEITGKEKYLEIAKQFSHNAILSPLANGIDQLSHKHANTQIPKIIGAASIFASAPLKYPSYKNVSENFFNFVVNNRSYAIGGNSIGEHFEDLGLESLGIKNCESCNTYNMLKLTEYIFSWNHKSAYMDYYENALFNHILGQQDPENGAKQYFVSLLPGYHRNYEKFEESWWCCTGTGMENPARYKRCMFFEENDSLYFNLYMPCKFDWESKGLSFEIETKYPYSEKIIIKVTGGNADATFSFRAPSWTNNNTALDVNHGKATASGKGEYISINRTWMAGDEIMLTIPLELRTYTSRNTSQIAFMYGPLTLGSKLKKVSEVSGASDTTWDEIHLDETVIDAPGLVLGDLQPKDLLSKLEIIEKDEGIFAIPEDYISTKEKMILQPFYTIHHYFHEVYWTCK